MPESLESQIVERLDTLIKLQALDMVRQFESQKEKIFFLARVGMRPREISELLETSANSVSVALAKAKAAEKKKAENTAKPPETAAG